MSGPSLEALESWVTWFITCGLRSPGLEIGIIRDLGGGTGGPQLAVCRPRSLIRVHVAVQCAMMAQPWLVPRAVKVRRRCLVTFTTVYGLGSGRIRNKA